MEKYPWLCQLCPACCWHPLPSLRICTPQWPVSTWEEPVGSTVGDWEEQEEEWGWYVDFPQLLPWGITANWLCPSTQGPSSQPRPPSCSCNHLSSHRLRPQAIAGPGDLHHLCGLPTWAHICINSPLIKFSDYPFWKCHLFPVRNLTDKLVINRKQLTQC